jgi:cysteine-rich repeat protein
MRHTLFGLAIGCAVLGSGRAEAACAPVTNANAATLCSAPSGPCVIDGKVCSVVAGTTLDFGTRDVVLQHGSRLDVGAGTMTLKGNSLTLQAGTALIGAGGAIVVQTQGNVSVLRNGATLARIDVADPSAADHIEITSTAGTVQVDGLLDARGTNTDGSGGSIDIAGNDILVSGDILASGGNLGGGGEVSMNATATVTDSGYIEVLGGVGGPLDVESDGSIALTGKIDMRATAPGSEGGLFTVLTTSGSITIAGKVFLQGDQGTDLDGGSDGGELDIFSGGALTLSADFDVSGAAPDGTGGDVFIMSELDTVQTGLIQDQGRGSESQGGSTEFECHRQLTLGSIDVHGGESLQSSGGTVQAAAWCDLSVPDAVALTALGDAGQNMLQAGGQMTIAGTLKAGGTNVLQYLDLSPIITNTAVIVPPPSLTPNPALTPCGGVAPAGCGNNTTNPPMPNDPGEQCDDGNTTSCDGCSSSCQLEVCGNGIVDCGEACDDGNTVDGDGCHGDCSRLENVCGDGIVDPAEECDDGNVTSCDGCSSACRHETCGNGVLDCGEECDDGNLTDGDGCSSTCRIIPIGCGNGVVGGTEECDDGNTVDGDGCSHQCRKEICGNGIVDPGEECDDFNTAACDGCSPTCKLEVCGNGILDCGEECDDGAANGAPGGSCLPDVCRHGQFCVPGSTDPCIPCAATTDCDPAGMCGPAACVAGVCTPAAPPVCDDGNPCNGTEGCDPATGCTAGAPLACDDGDACTVDGCDPQSGCTSTPLVGLDLALCRIGTARDVVTNAPPAQITTGLRAKLLKMLAGAESRLQTAKGNAHKLKKSVRAANQQAKRVVKLVTKQSGHKLAPKVASDILAALGVFPVVVPS